MDCNFTLEESIFTNARRIADSDVRERYILDACGGNAELQIRIRLLLRVLSEEDAFLESPVETTSAIDLLYGEPEEVGSSIGPYRLVEQIGVGGMGLVFLARQDSPVRRTVALKIIRPGMDSREVIARFETERQSLAQLNHPGITRLLDAGTTDRGRPWFVMELAAGMPITDYCKQRSVVIPERLRLFESVCRSLHHAHQNGVIHRDIKPPNVIVTEVDGQPFAKVIDFGVSRLREQAAAEKRHPEPTQNSFRPESLVGTPAYMSPEQTTLPDNEVDERSDVYALGMLLYQLLTDSQPLPEISRRDIGFTETRRIIQMVSPQIPSQRVLDNAESDLKASSDSVEDRATPTVASNRIESQRLSSQLQGDLDWITMKAIEKDRSQRYQSVAELAADIGRYLQHEPVYAVPPSRIYRLKKLWRRRKSRVLILTLTLLLVLLAGVSASIVWKSIDHRKTVVEHTAKLDTLQALSQRQSEVNTLNQAFEEYFRGRADVALHKLQLCKSIAKTDSEPGFALNYLKRLCHSEPRAFKGKGGRVFDVSFSPDSQLVVSCTGNTHLSLDIRNVVTGELVRSMTGFDNDVNCAHFSADGSMLITAEESRIIRAWDVQTGTELYRLDGFSQPLATVYLGQDQRTVMTSGVDWNNKAAVTWICDLHNPDQRAQFSGQLLLDVDESRGIVALVSDAGEVTLRRFPGLELISLLPGLQPKTVCGALSSDGKRLATGSMDGNTHVRQIEEISDATLMRSEPIPPAVRDVAYSPDNRLLIEVMGTGVIHVWDTLTQALQKVLLTHDRETWSCAVSPDGKWLAIGCNNGTTELHSLKTIASLQRPIRQIKSPNPRTSVDRFSRDYAVINESGSVDIYSSDDDQLIQSIAIPEKVVVRNAEFSPDGKCLWVADDGGRIFKFNRATAELAKAFPTFDQPVTPPICSPNGEYLAVSTSNVEPREGFVGSGVWNSSSGKESFRLPDNITESLFMPHRVNAFLDDSTAVTSQQNTVARWNVTTGIEILPRFEEPNGWIFYCAAVPDNRSLLLGLRDATVCIWDPTSNKVIRKFRGLRYTLNASAFSADGDTLVTATHGGEVRLWDLPTGLLICELTGAAGSISDIWFSKDESRLLAFVEKSGGVSEVYIWDATGP